MSKDKELNLTSEYKYGFKTDTKSVRQTKRGLSEEIVREISSIKQEPEWMLNLRLDALKAFYEIKNPSWGPDLSNIDFDDIIYYIKPS
ncbi:MAG TPA: Fe-S cluster assembly protein SufB, partial [Bacillota bacterium]|nr:Fe-S cluster assembly protein SufB [Bacillota bacterium]